MIDYEKKNVFHTFTFYKCIPISNPSILRQRIRKQAANLQIIGTIMLTEEGINSTFPKEKYILIQDFIRRKIFYRFFGSVRISRSHNVLSSIRPSSSSQSRALNHHHSGSVLSYVCLRSPQVSLRSLSGLSQVSLRSLSGLSRVSLRSLSGLSQVSLRSLSCLSHVSLRFIYTLSLSSLTLHNRTDGA